MTLLRHFIADEIRLLTFQAPSDHVQENRRGYLALGLICTWIAGIGRYWDNPRAHWLQFLGLGSVAYVFCLALVVWLLALPLRPRSWSYLNVLVFITMTSPPAWLYAIPVERFMAPRDASLINGWFLALVALWRVSLYVGYLKRSELTGAATMILGLLPLALIVVALTALNLEHAVFELMGGIRRGTSSDGAFFVVILLSYLAVLSAPFLILSYLGLIWRAVRERRLKEQDP